MLRLHPIASSIALIGTMFLPVAASAQEAVQLEPVIVTGSNIRRTANSEGVNAVQVITAAEIANRGQVTLDEVLRTLTANSGNSYNESYTNGFAPGSAGIALRGLTQKYTLVLLNGRRVAPYGFAQNLQDTFVDLGSIPVSAIDRVEILKDGASAIYGSDAVAGVVNIILKRNAQGGTVDASAGLSSRGDGFERNAAITYGFGSLDDNGYNLTVTGSYFRRSALSYTDRGITKGVDFRDRGGILAWTLGGTNAATYRTSPRTPFPTCGSAINGQVVPGSDLNPPVNGSICAFNPASYYNLMPEAERLQLVASGEVRLGNGITGFADVLASHNTSGESSTPASLGPTSVTYGSGTGMTPVGNVLPAGNPSNPFSDDVGINYSFQDVGAGRTAVTSNFYRVVAGLRGLNAGWDWEAAAGHSESKSAEKKYNLVNASVLAQVIADGSYNFVDPSQTPGATNALRLNTRRDATSKLDTVGVKATSDIASLPAGALGFATGLDFRRESLTDRPDAALTQGLVLSQGSTATDASRNVWAVYTEFLVPIVPKLEATLAGRYDKYSDAGTAFSPKAGLRYQPSEVVTFRSTWSKGFRAPTLTENARNSSGAFFTNVLDSFADPSSPTGVSQFSTPIAGVLSGNPNLKPEKTRTWTLGTVLTLDPTTTFSLDYYNVHIANVITTDSFQYIVDHPDQFPGQIDRDADGNLRSITVGYKNLTKLDTDGFDFALDKRLRLGAYGQLDWATTLTYVASYKTPPTPDQPTIDLAGGNLLGTPIPRYRANSALTWDVGHWSSTLAGYYIHGYNQYLDATGQQLRVRGSEQFDLSLAYSGVKNLKLYGTIYNLADKMPPWDASRATLPYDVTLYSARGRFFRVGASYRF